MAVLFFLLGFFLFSGSDSFAQTYKYVDRKGTICFTDNPPSFLFKDEVASGEAKPKQVTLEQGRTRPRIKDIFQLGQEMLEQELTKPEGKQNLRLIKELGENLYGDVSGRKDKEAQASSRR
jgi:hypothetical protein